MHFKVPWENIYQYSLYHANCASKYQGFLWKLVYSHPPVNATGQNTLSVRTGNIDSNEDRNFSTKQGIKKAISMPLQGNLEEERKILDPTELSC
ncbi:hypothetical protein TNCV_971711 [Trichonephila clavipes]|nr:hypothetical protein TNCV_971711 [Trichonephila clavipes]